MKINQLLETPIDMTGDPNDPTVYGHEKANPMSLKGRIMSARAQLKELAELAESDSLLAWEEICKKAKGGMFMGLEQNLEQIRHGIEELAAKRKQGGVQSRGIDRNIGEQGEEQFKSPNENFASITQAPDGTFTITYKRENITLTGTPRDGEIDPPLEKIPTYQQAYELAKKDYDLETEFLTMPPSIKVNDSTEGVEEQQVEAVGDFGADPKGQAQLYLQFHNGEMDPSTLPKFMAITPNLQLAVQPLIGTTGSHEEVLASLSAANKRLPKELQASWDELKDLGGVSDTIKLTGEPHPDTYNPATDPVKEVSVAGSGQPTQPKVDPANYKVPSVDFFKKNYEHPADIITGAYRSETDPSRIGGWEGTSDFADLMLGLNASYYRARQADPDYQQPGFVKDDWELVQRMLGTPEGREYAIDTKIGLSSIHDKSPDAEFNRDQHKEFEKQANARFMQQPDGVVTPGWKYDQKLGMTPAQAELQKQKSQQPATALEGYENPDEYHVLRHQTKDDIEKEMTPKGWTRIKEFDSYQESQNAMQEMKDKFPNQKFTVTSHSKKRREEQRKEWNLPEAKGPCWKKYKQVGIKTKNGKQVPNCVPKE
jgi:hypothetical protein